MKELTKLPTDAVTVVNSKVITSSLKVAEIFGKQHKDVLKAINNLDLPQDFNQRNFAPVEYLDSKGEKRPAYNISRDGFTILAMGFTGKEAMRFKLDYIQRFNDMESTLRNGPAVPHPQTRSLEGSLIYEVFEGFEIRRLIIDNKIEWCYFDVARALAIKQPYTLLRLAPMSTGFAKRKLEHYGSRIQELIFISTDSLEYLLTSIDAPQKTALLGFIQNRSGQTTAHSEPSMPFTEHIANNFLREENAYLKGKTEALEFSVREIAQLLTIQKHIEI